jgi:hypothetical protein
VQYFSLIDGTTDGLASIEHAAVVQKKGKEVTGKVKTEAKDLVTHGSSSSEHSEHANQENDWRREILEGRKKPAQKDAAPKQEDGAVDGIDEGERRDNGESH